MKRPNVWRRLEVEVLYDPEKTNWVGIVAEIQRFRGVIEAYKTREVREIDRSEGEGRAEA